VYPFVGLPVPFVDAFGKAAIWRRASCTSAVYRYDCMYAGRAVTVPCRTISSSIDCSVGVNSIRRATFFLVVARAYEACASS
jgi:hypothetical protein